MSHLHVDVLRSITAELQSRDDETKAAAAASLQRLTINVVRESPADVRLRYMNELRNVIHDLVNATTMDEKKGGVMAISALIDVDTQDNATKIARFANFLKNVLPCADPQVMEMAAQTLGRLAQVGGTLSADIVDFEVGRAFEWLSGERHETRRYAAVLLLRELSQNAPTLFYVHITDFFELFFNAVRDPNIATRRVAIDALVHCLQLISQRQSTLGGDWLRRLFEEVLVGMLSASQNNSSSSHDSVHGSLLTLSVLLAEAPEFMKTHFNEVTPVLQFQTHKSVNIRQAVLTLIPQLASISKDEFVAEYMKPCLSNLVAQLKNITDRDNAFVAIGKLARVVKESIAPFLPTIFKAAEDALVATKRNKNQISLKALTCVAMLTEAMGPPIRRSITDILDIMVMTGLSDELVSALTRIATHLPDLLSDIQHRLLDMLSLILNGRPYSPPGTPAGAPAGVSPLGANRAFETVLRSQTDDAGPPFIARALETLGSFDFSGQVLTEFVRHCVVNYLEDDHALIRRQAALTCTALLVEPDTPAPTRGHGAIVIGEVLEKLIVVGIADPEPRIREAVLASLDWRLDHHLAQADILRSLFIALKDEAFDIRDHAVKLIGRLTMRNPAYVMPALRKTLIQLLTELEFSGDVSNKEESARLLGSLIASSHRLIKPYVEPVIKALIPKLQEPTGSLVSIYVLAALGELAVVAGDDMAQYVEVLLPLIIETLQDQSSLLRRQVAMHTLGQLCQSTGHVVAPYAEHPALLGILLGSLSSESDPTIRRDVMTVLGILGAVDPYRHKVVQQQHRAAEGGGDTHDVPALDPSTLRPSSYEYYPAVAVSSLISILRDPSLAKHHKLVVITVMQIFQTMGVRAAPFLSQVMPPILQVTRTCDPSLREALFQHLASLVAIVKQHIRDYLDELFDLVDEYWNSPLLIQIVTLVEQISQALNDEFKVYLPKLIPQMLRVIHNDISESGLARRRVLSAFETFGTNLDDYLHLVVPAICKVIEQAEAPLRVRVLALQVLGRLCTKLNFSEYASRIILPLSRVLRHASPDLVDPLMTTLCALVVHLGNDFAVFIPMINKVLINTGLTHARYDALVSKLLKGALGSSTMPDDMDGDEDGAGPSGAAGVGTGGAAGAGTDTTTTAAEPEITKLPVNEQALQRAWEATQKSTKDDWMQWIRKFSVELLKSSSSPALRACWALAQVHPPLARQLFNAAFLSCWTELFQQYKDALVTQLTLALCSDSLPAEILQQLLNLCEFMEHDDQPLPIDIRTLGHLAEKCRAYAKALHYKELEFGTHPDQTIEALISVNNQLGQPEAAEGILVYARQRHAVVLKSSWYEKLQRWDNALLTYENDAEQAQPGEVLLEPELGRLRCLHALGEWEKLSERAAIIWTYLTSQPQTATAGAAAAAGAGAGTAHRRPTDNTADAALAAIAPMAAAAAWNLGDWDEMASYAANMEVATVDGAFFRAIVAAHHNQGAQARHLVNRARELIDTELTALVGESYDRAYPLIVRLQQLSEIEETLAYRNMDEDQRAIMHRMWQTRLRGCERSVDVWQRVLAVRGLVLSVQDSCEEQLEFAQLCRTAGRLRLASKIVGGLLGDAVGGDPRAVDVVSLDADPAVVFSFIRQLWAEGDRELAVTRLQQLIAISRTEAPPTSRHVAALSVSTVDVSFVGHAGSSEPGDRALSPIPGGAAASPVALAAASPGAASSRAAVSVVSVDHRLLARCLLCLGEWQLTLMQDAGTLDTGVCETALASFEKATICESGWYNAWHAFAKTNFDVIQHWESTHAADANPDDACTADPRIQRLLVPALEGFFNAIALGSEGTMLQDTLRVLTLWFKYGAQAEVESALYEGFSLVRIDTWLNVIPQLIARIHTPDQRIRKTVIDLLIEVGRKHPEALVYPLTVASKSQSARRRQVALRVVASIKRTSVGLMEEALMVSEELIRVAILWHEQWHEALEDASRLYFADHDTDGMIATLAQVHEMMAAGPQTLREVSFMHSYGRDLAEAQQWCRRYLRTRKVNDLNQAWDLYYFVFRRINKQLPEMTTLDLHYISPALLEARDLQLPVPGTYQANQPVVRIARFGHLLHVITSKQRPRRISIYGSNGRQYKYLLKGHEDLRQDERVMQLFGLVNTLLSNDTETSRKHLGIIRYAIIPLSPYSGLLGWVPGTDTLHGLVVEYREGKGIPLTAEHRLMMAMAPSKFDTLTPIQRVEIFEHALANTAGDDLYHVLWLKSPSSEAWLERRTNYTRSLAVMSMVGYILGLGDRHPSNLMLDRRSGKVVHIDFGDAFDVARDRDKYPEMVPFRLTRMLRKAMEVSEIEGNFRSTCEAVMRVLRENGDALLAVLEAFVHDPLINWRLLVKNDAEDNAGAGATAPTPASPDAQTPTPHPGAEQGDTTDDKLTYTNDAAPAVRRKVIDEGELDAGQDAAEPQLNERAVAIVNRIESKLKGRDFLPDQTLGVQKQVDLLIREATDNVRLASMYPGWRPFW